MKKFILKSASLMLAFAKQVAMTDALHRWATACSALSSSSRSSRMVFKGIMCFALVFFFLSCRSHNIPLISRMDTNNYQVHALQRIDTVLLHDSVFIQERTKGDTVYLTRTEYRDRWRIREVHDTIHNTQYITQTIEHPPEKYVPKFYKWCTGLLWAIGLLAIGYWLLKWRAF